MAQQDTGMGWSANAEWLVQVAADIAQIKIASGGAQFPGQPIPILNNPSATDVVTAGIHVFTFTHPTYHWTNDLYATANNTAFIYAGNAGTYISATAITDSPNTIISYVSVVNGTPTLRTVVTQSQISGTSLYYAQFSNTSTSDTVFHSDIPVFSGTYFDTLSTAASYITITDVPIHKDNAGYAVGCIAKWKTSASAVITTPVLISSVTEYTDMTDGSGQYNLAKLNILRDGMRFYMSFFDITDNPTIASALPLFDYTGPEYGSLTLENVFKFIASTAYADIRIIHSPDPYEEEGADTGEEGGDGEDSGSDDAGIEAGSDFPSAINTGFCRIFSPSESELRDLSNYLWSNSYDLAQVKKLFSNPMDSILGLSAVPIRLLGSSVSFSLGGVPISGMTLPLVTQQRYTYHMGSITINERWGSYLDYDPYTKFSIFLPFIGMRELAADDIMGKTVSLVYDVDILTGMCVARLQAGTNCLYEWGGNCAIQLPINSRNWDSVFSTAVSAVGGIVSAVTGGSAPLVAGSVASAALQTVSMKPRIDKSSTIGGAAGWLGQMTPYIIRTTPEAFIPVDQNKFIGYPAYINVSLDAISGYNEVESIHLENVTATGAELEEIESILKGGVIF